MGMKIKTPDGETLSVSTDDDIRSYYEHLMGFKHLTRESEKVWHAPIEIIRGRLIKELNKKGYKIKK